MQNKHNINLSQHNCFAVIFAPWSGTVGSDWGRGFITSAFGVQCPSGGDFLPSSLCYLMSTCAPLFSWFGVWAGLLPVCWWYIVIPVDVDGQPTGFCSKGWSRALEAAVGWLKQSWLKLNLSKMEVLCLVHQRRIWGFSTQILPGILWQKWQWWRVWACSWIPPFQWQPQSQTLPATAFCHLCQVGQLVPYLSPNDLVTVIHNEHLQTGVM